MPAGDTIFALLALPITASASRSPAKKTSGLSCVHGSPEMWTRRMRKQSHFHPLAGPTSQEINMATRSPTFVTLLLES